MARFKRILLRNTGNYALVDLIDYERITAFGSWYENDQGYAVKRVVVNGKKKTIRMHALINNTPKGLVTDHINRNKLDNRRRNLRSVSQAINMWNKKEINRHTKYDLPSGISYDKTRGRYFATKIIRKRFDTLKEAISFVNDSEKEEI